MRAMVERENGPTQTMRQVSEQLQNKQRKKQEEKVPRLRLILGRRKFEDKNRSDDA